MTATNVDLGLICKNDNNFCTVQQTNTNTEPWLNKQLFVLQGVWLWAGGVDKDERPGFQKRMVLKRQASEKKTYCLGTLGHIPYNKFL